MIMFQLRVETSNAAFVGDDGPGGQDLFRELGAMLRRLGQHIEDLDSLDEEPHVIRDSNGNTIGSWQYVRD